MRDSGLRRGRLPRWQQWLMPLGDGSSDAPSLPRTLPFR